MKNCIKMDAQTQILKETFSHVKRVSNFCKLQLFFSSVNSQVKIQKFRYFFHDFVRSFECFKETIEQKLTSWWVSSDMVEIASIFPQNLHLLTNNTERFKSWKESCIVSLNANMKATWSFQKFRELGMPTVFLRPRMQQTKSENAFSSKVLICFICVGHVLWSCYFLKNWGSSLR